MGNMLNPHRAIAMMTLALWKQGKEASLKEVWSVIEELKDDLDLTPGDLDLFNTTLQIFQTYPREVIEQEAPISVEKYLKTEEGKRVKELLLARNFSP